jgi:EAL domain-containing protein (putative c-di-GMP-specific phosphodiesterase class I)
MTMMPAPYTLLRQAAAPRATLMEQRRAGLTWRDVERIIAKGQFVLVYQPVVRLMDRAVVYHEARLRLHPATGLPPLAPQAFVTAAEEFGLGPELDEAVLEAAQASLVPVSVNICARSLQTIRFLPRALARLSGCRAKVTVELTRTEEIDDLAAVAASVGELRATGTEVSLDELDGEPGSLACVRAIAFDTLKIAGSVVRGATAGARGRQLLAALLQLSRSVGARTVAKHVETLPQAWAMQSAGVDLGQGWLFGAPAPLRETHLLS